jgi:hypothetical protein
MKKRLSIALALAIASACLLAEDHAGAAKVAGEWQMSLETPHGTMAGPLKLQQDGAKITGTYETEHAGKVTLTGKVERTKVTFSMDAPGGQMTITFNGAVDGDKMSGTADPMGGAWSATRK